MAMNKDEFVDKSAYDEFYAEVRHSLLDCRHPEELRVKYETRYIAPFYAGGPTKGFVRGEAVRSLIASVGECEDRSSVKILDAGCGQGELSLYLGCLGFSVVGVDISRVACEAAQAAADRLGLSDRVSFLSTSLEDLSALENSSVDRIIGHASLHHFIKYPKVPDEFNRVLKPRGVAYFADSFGENRLFRLFQNREQMRRLGDVLLTKDLVEKYFDCFRCTIHPKDWMVMFDKLYLKLLPRKLTPLVRAVSRMHFILDRMIPENRLTLWFSGAVLTVIERL